MILLLLRVSQRKAQRGITRGRAWEERGDIDLFVWYGPACTQWDALTCLLHALRRYEPCFCAGEHRIVA